MSYFDRVPLAPDDPIFGLNAAFQADPNPRKVNLGVGIYKTEDLKTPVLSSVKAAEKAILEAEKNKEYLPISGEPNYLDKMGDLVFGPLWQGERERIAAFQTVGGTGALKVAGTFFKEEVQMPIWISNPTWPNHAGVLSGCGLKLEYYPYYDGKKHQVDFQKIAGHFEKLPEKTIVLLHASCHNPTGADFSPEEWKALFALFKEKRLIPFFDFAYQGFGTGLDEDAQGVRYFVENGIEALIAVSNAKNFALYGERVGCLFACAASAKIAQHIASRVKQIIRANYSNPPMHGAKIVAHILGAPELRRAWEGELKEMNSRIHAMRKMLAQRLSQTGDFGHMLQGKGMFGYTGLARPQVERLAKEFGIYMTLDGRINVCGLNQKNIDYVADAIIKVTHA